MECALVGSPAPLFFKRRIACICAPVGSPGAVVDDVRRVSGALVGVALTMPLKFVHPLFDRHSWLLLHKERCPLGKDTGV